MNDLGSGCMTKAEETSKHCDSLTFGVLATDLAYVIRSQLGCMPSSDSSVPLILSIGTGVQVRERGVGIDVNAQADIAVVQDVEFFGADNQTPDDTVRQFGVSVNVDAAVPATVRLIGPEPARPTLGTVIRDWSVLVDLRPEAIRKGNLRTRQARGVTRRLAVATAAPGNFGPLGLKRCAARQADAVNARKPGASNGTRCGTILVHRTLHRSGATPRPALTGAGILRVNFTTNCTPSKEVN